LGPIVILFVVNNFQFRINDVNRCKIFYGNCTNLDKQEYRKKHSIVKRWSASNRSAISQKYAIVTTINKTKFILYIDSAKYFTMKGCNASDFSLPTLIYSFDSKIYIHKICDQRLKRTQIPCQAVSTKQLLCCCLSATQVMILKF